MDTEVRPASGALGAPAPDEDRRDSPANIVRGLRIPDDHALRNVAAPAVDDRSGDADGGDATAACPTVIEDRRDEPDAALSWPLLLDSIRELVDSPQASSGQAVLALRGKYLALATLESPAPVLAVVECMDHGDIATVVLFDSDDVVAASRFLAHRYLVYLPEPLASAFAVTVNWTDAIVRRNFDDAERLIADDFTWHDHRHEPPLVHQRPTAVQGLRIVVSDDNELIDLVTEIHLLTERGVLVSRTQVTPSALDVDSPELTMLAVSDGSVDRIAFWEYPDFEAAVSALEDLSAQQTS